MENLVVFSNFNVINLYGLSKKKKKNLKEKVLSISLFKPAQQTNLCDCISLFFNRHHRAHKKATVRLD